MEPHKFHLCFIKCKIHLVYNMEGENIYKANVTPFHTRMEWNSLARGSTSLFSLLKVVPCGLSSLPWAL